MKENMLTGGVIPDVANPLLDAQIKKPNHVQLIVEDNLKLPT
ncbi:asparaginase, partial [Enterococcus faecium]